MLRNCPDCGTTEVVSTGHKKNCLYEGLDIEEAIKKEKELVDGQASWDQLAGTQPTEFVD